MKVVDRYTNSLKSRSAWGGVGRVLIIILGGSVPPDPENPCPISD